MSKVAEMKLDDGSWVAIHIKDLTEADYHREFRCGWRSPDGTSTCQAPMSIAYSRDTGTPLYFTEAKRVAAKHLPECKRQRHKKNRTLSSYDQTGSGQSKNDYLEKMLGNRIAKSKKPTVVTPPNEIQEGGEITDNVAGMDDRPINIKSKLPSTTLRMAKFLESLPLDSTYMDEKVHNWIIDFRTIDEYIENGIPTDDYIFFVGTLVFPESVNIQRSPNEWVLADCRYQKGDLPEDHLFVRMKLDTKAYEAMKKFSHGSRKYRCYVVVCAKFSKEDGHDNLYTAAAVNRRMIAFIPKNRVCDSI